MLVSNFRILNVVRFMEDSVHQDLAGMVFLVLILLTKLSQDYFNVHDKMRKLITFNKL